MKTYGIYDTMRWHKRAGLALLTGLLLGLPTFSGCDDDLWQLKDEAEGSYKPSDGNPISTTLDESGDFAEWVHVLNYSDSYAVLNALYDGQSKAHKFTLFAPTDEALQAFYRSKGVTSVDELGVDYARALVRTMTYDGDSLKLSELFGPSVEQLAYVSEAGETFTVAVDAEQTGYLLNDSVHVSQRYLTSSNGFVYTADGVVAPLVESIVDRIAADGQSTIMLAALRATGLDQTLATLADTTYTLGRREIRRHRYTFLNVRDEAFASTGIMSLADLQARLLDAAPDASVGADSLLRQYLQYHLFDSDYTLAQLHEMIGPDTMRIWNTSAPTQILMITKHLYDVEEHMADDGTVSADSSFYYSFNDGDDTYGRRSVIVSGGLGTRQLEVEATVTMQAHSNVKAKNGYVHSLSDWMPVYEPKQTTVVWDLADYSEARNALGPTFQPQAAVTSESKIDISQLPCYTVERGPDGSANNSYSSLCYVTCKSNLKGCLNYDRVVFNVGYQGSVTMSTPTLVKGKYRVSISMAYLTEQSFIRTSKGCKGGMMRLTVDGEHQILTAPYTTITKALAGVYETTLYDEIEFDETGSHVFRFVVMDPAASTNAKFSLQFDAITFTPVE